MIKQQRVDKGERLHFSAISLFPEMFKAVSEFGVVGRAIKNHIVSLDCINPRDFTQDRHKTVDDRPYGGGPGMLMKMEPLQQAIQAAKAKSDGHLQSAKVIYLSPAGQPINQRLVKQLSQEKHLILLSGRYEGVDQRLIDQFVDKPISLGDFVLSGGELAAMALIDAVTRILPKVLGHSDSAQQDSFEDGLLDHPHYTRPENHQGMEVPSVLLSGDHQAIEAWRLQQRLGRTWLERPDLLADKKLTKNEESLLAQFKEAYRKND